MHFKLNLNKCIWRIKELLFMDGLKVSGNFEAQKLRKKVRGVGINLI